MRFIRYEVEYVDTLDIVEKLLTVLVQQNVTPPVYQWNEEARRWERTGDTCN